MIEQAPQVREQSVGRVVRFRTADVYLGALGIVLWGYAVLGRGFAQFGIPPLYAGEGLVCLALIAFVMQRRRFQGVRSTAGWVLILLLTYSAVRAGLDLPRYGLDSIRDLALIYYSIVGLAMAAILPGHTDRLDTIVRWFRRFALIFPVLGIAVWWYTFVSDLPVPLWPGTDVPLARVKAGDTMVHASGIVAFIAIFGRRDRKRLPIQMVSIAALALFGMSVARAGMLSFLCALGMLVVLRVVNLRLTMTVVGVAGLVWASSMVGAQALALRDVEHSASWGQLVENVKSVADLAEGTNLDSDLAGPAIWRLLWWSDIARYTLLGPYRWSGKGFGVNLADDDGYQTLSDGSLRSPHNANMTVLARMGVPGALIWLTFHAFWVAGVWRTVHRAGSGDPFVANVGRVLLVYWTAMFVNASFDVYLEGPMGGVWYWALIGVGLSLPTFVRPTRALVLRSSAEL